MVALLRKETCNFRHPVGLCHPVWAALNPQKSARSQNSQISQSQDSQVSQFQNSQISQSQNSQQLWRGVIWDCVLHEHVNILKNKLALNIFSYTITEVLKFWEFFLCHSRARRMSYLEFWKVSAVVVLYGKFVSELIFQNVYQCHAADLKIVPCGSIGSARRTCAWRCKCMYINMYIYIYVALIYVYIYICILYIYIYMWL